MRLKSFLFLIVGVFALVAFVWFYTQNEEQLTRTVDLFGWQTHVWVVILIAFIAGIGCLLPIWVVRDFRSAVSQLRRSRVERKDTQVEEEYRAGMNAVVHHRAAEAEKAFRSVLDRRPDHQDALIALGQVLRDQGEFEAAAECHRKAIRRDEEDLRAQYALAEDHEAAGELAAAESVYRRITELRPKRSVAAYEKLRDIHVLRGEWERALETQDRLEKLPAAGRERRELIQRARLGLEYQVALLRLAEGDARGCMIRLKKILRAEPDFTPAYVSLGNAAERLDRDDEAVSWFREGFARTGSPVFLTRIEEHHLSRQDPAGAIAAFRDLVGKRRSDVLPRFFLGRLFSRLEMNDEAWEVFTDLQAELPESPTLAYYVARVHERRGEYEEACRLYRKVVQATEGLRMWYRCTGCGEEVAGWQAFCPRCRAWDTYRVEWMEPTTPRELDVGEVRPVWSAAEDTTEATARAL